MPEGFSPANASPLQLPRTRFQIERGGREWRVIVKQWTTMLCKVIWGDSGNALGVAGPGIMPRPDTVGRAPKRLKTGNQQPATSLQASARAIVAPRA